MVKKLQKDNSGLVRRSSGKSEGGFTIIEVLIVLAIAALIMLIVFLAIPALQRNQRNTSRRNDVGRVGSVSTEFVTNNNGRLPGVAPGTPAADQTTIETSAGQLSQYPTSGYLTIAAIGGTVTPITNIDAMRLVTGAKCDADNNPEGAVEAGTARSMALQYAVERAGGNTTSVCQEI